MNPVRNCNTTSLIMGMAKPSGPKLKWLERAVHKILSACLLSLVLGCCPAVQTKSAQILPPSWYQNRHQVSADCGFGTVEFNGDYGLSETTAIDFARDELGRNLRSKIQSYVEARRMATRQTNQTGVATQTGSSQEQFVRSVSDQSVKYAIPKATELVGDQFFAMVCIDTNRFFDALKQNKDLNPIPPHGIKAMRMQGSALDGLLKNNQ